MQPEPLEDRVTLLESKLQGLPERMGAVEVRLGSLEEQVVQFRGEVRSEFSATREEFHQEIGRVESSLHKKFDTGFDELGAEMHALHAVAMLELGKAIERSMSQTAGLVSSIEIIRKSLLQLSEINLMHRS
jgi:predicted nuclease with TOPRIM domain